MIGCCLCICTLCIYRTTRNTATAALNGGRRVGSGLVEFMRRIGRAIWFVLALPFNFIALLGSGIRSFWSVVISAIVFVPSTILSALLFIPTTIFTHLRPVQAPLEPHIPGVDENSDDEISSDESSDHLDAEEFFGEDYDLPTDCRSQSVQDIITLYETKSQASAKTF